MAAPVLAPGARLEDPGRDDADSQLRISNIEGGTMIGVAFLFDAFQLVFGLLVFIPIIGLIPSIIFPLLMSIISFCTFGVWFATKRVNYFTGKQAAMKLLAIFAALVIDLVPFLNSLPAITAGVVLMIVATRIEDTVGKRKLLEKRLRARKFWSNVANSRLVGGLTGGLAGRMLGRAYERGSNRMAAQVAYGRKKVSKEEAKGGVGSLRGQMQAIAAEAPRATIDSPATRGTFDSHVEDLHRRYATARQNLAELRRRRREQELERRQGRGDIPDEYE
ncbi:MAG TPA: hypothetical protein VEB18_01055 [Candidatus Paceibacterota bacterium]|nr:hypothetical protein [Candidatus Paceibacterota bacterium]